MTGSSSSAEPSTAEPSTAEPSIAKPLADYAPYRRAGDLVILSGIIAVDPDTHSVVRGYDDLAPDERGPAGATGQMSVDAKEGPVAAQTWWILRRIQSTVEQLGGTTDDVVHLVQYFRDLRDFPVFNRVRATFFDTMPASTIVEVSGLLPSDDCRIEIQATAHLPN